VSPEFSWSNVPEGTKSFIMLMTDPEGRGGAGVVHWVWPAFQCGEWRTLRRPSGARG
jgi:hypothetical protein